MFPRLEVDLAKVRHNAAAWVSRCAAVGVQVAGVIKGCSGLPEVSRAMVEGGVSFLASSRLEQLQDARAAGLGAALMLIRVPMLSELARVVELCDISLASDLTTLRALDAEARRQGRRHQVILMVDLGDLREGFWDHDELVAAASVVEGDLDALELAGVGTALMCYGSIDATPEKLAELVAVAERIEAEIGRRLRYLAGGATTSLARILDGNLPERINLLRVGEAILLARDLRTLWPYDLSFVHDDAFTLLAEVIEVRDKPTYPVGEIAFDAFGQRPTYVDRGIRRRALAAVGKVDVGSADQLIPRRGGVEIVGAASDHLILDVQDADPAVHVGDVLDFDLWYGALPYATASRGVTIVPLGE